MDKVEYKIKIKELMRLSGQKNYKAAAQIADDIRWEKVKNVQMLCTVSEVYEKVGRYDESKDVLLLAYNRSPNGKMIVYRLAELSIAMGDYQDATDFYHEYMQMSPGDNSALLLKYKIYKGRGANLETLIALLEDYKTREYQEEWVLELARLYHQAGDREKCIDICNEIDLWFNKGRSVIEALEIKKMYEPLTPLQERKLANRSEYIGKDRETPIKEPQPVKPRPAQKEKRKAPQPEEVVRRQPAQAPRQQSVAEILDKLKELEMANTHPMPIIHVPEPESEPEPKPVQPSKVPDDPVAAAIVRMAREQQKSPGELERGFSILPKGKVVNSGAEEFAFDLPQGVEEVELATVAPTHERVQATELRPEKKALLEEIMGEPEEAIEEKKIKSERTFEAEAVGESEEKSSGIFSKMFNKLKMEDDELDDDFNDDYIEDELEYNNDDGMVRRGLTGQYEKVVIEEDESDDDPLNTRMTASARTVNAGEYEYSYEDEDEAGVYEDIEHEDEAGMPAARSSKRYNFFHNTAEDDELFYDKGEEEVSEAEGGQEYQPDYEEEIYEEPQTMSDVVPLSYAAKYDTLNLQKELAKSIQQLMDATEKETVDSTLENVKKLVEECHIPKLTETMKFKAIKEGMLKASKQRKEQEPENKAQDERKPAEDAAAGRSDGRPKPAIELAIKLKPIEDNMAVPFDQILTREDDGQLSLLFPEEIQEEEQIEGQMNIDDVIREMEKQKLLSENDKENRALEEARKRALEETQGIMTEIMGLLKDVIPKIGSIKDGEQKMADLAEALEKVQRSLPYTQGIMEATETGKEAASAIEAACAEAVEELERLEEQEDQRLAAEEIAASDMQEDSPYLFEEEEEAPMPDLEEAFYGMQQSLQQDQELEQQESMLDDEEYLKQKMALQQMFDSQEAETPGGQAAADEAQTAATEDTYEEVPKQKVSDKRQPRVKKQREKPVVDESDGLDAEQEEILSYFLAIKSVAPVIRSVVKQTESAPEHMIITGEKGSGKTSVAMRIIKASQVNKIDKVETIAKINAALLNQKDVAGILDKVNGGVLIIENAGSLKPSTVYAMEDALYNKHHVQIIAVDNQKAVKKLLTCTNSFLNNIRMRIDLPVYSNNELAEFARTYAELNGYNLDGMAVLALHSVIDIFQTDQHAANLEDVKNIMDEAMERADKRTNKLLGKLFGKKKSDHVDLLESDFE